MKRLKTKQQLEKIYGIENYYDFLINQWILGYKNDLIRLYKNLTLKERKLFILELLDTKIKEYELIIRYILLNS